MNFWLVHIQRGSQKLVYAFVAKNRASAVRKARRRFPGLPAKRVKMATDVFMEFE